MSVAPASARPYADVAVDVPGRRRAAPGGDPVDTFTYAIPAPLTGRVRVGHAVWVPFGRRRLQGVVVALRDHSEVERTRDIDTLADETPWLTPESIALARWMSRHYLAPFFGCLRTMLPPGALGREQRVYHRTERAPEADEGLSPAELALLGLFGRDRALSEAQLQRRIAPRFRRGARTAADALVERELLRRELRRSGPRVAARHERVARLVVEERAERDARLRALKPSPRADALDWLLRPEVVLPSPEELRAATGVSRAVLRGLLDTELVRLEPGGRFLETELGPDEVDEAVEARLGRAPAQAALLRALAAAPGPLALDDALAAADASPSAAEGLVDKSLARRIDTEDALLPTVRGARGREAALALRGLTGRAEALAYLEAAGGAAPEREIRAHTSASTRDLASLEEAGLVVRTERRSWRDPLDDASLPRREPPTLTEDQARAWERIEPLLGHPGWRDAPDGAAPGGAAPAVPSPARAPVCLLHGVTGSGKTELYLRAIERVLRQGRQAIVLVPEIALTAQTIARFAGRFPGRVGLWHSQMSEGERFDTWQRAREGRLDVIVGSRSALFTPLPRLGLIVVDEEHAEAYKQSQTPRYHARDTALQRAALTGSAVLLGSATPAVESMFQARRGDWTLAELPRRVVSGTGGPEDPGRMGELPPVRVVDMRSELRRGNRSIFSRALRAALEDVLSRGDQAILFLNRRGRATFVLCRDCGHALACPRCEIPLTVHGAGTKGARLICHHCGHRELPPLLCPECGSERIRHFGIGTERVEALTREAFPGVRTLRWDADTTGRRGAHEAILARFAGGAADVLVGTQMITKGLDLPLVTLVGVISADTALHFPDFRTAERAFQTLSQVAGRAGRSTRGGRVIFQTYDPSNPAIRYAAHHDYAGFYEREVAARARLRYPPWTRLARLAYLTERGDAEAEKRCEAMAARLREEIARLGLPDTDLIGPAPAFFRRERGRTRWQIVVRSPSPRPLLEAVAFGPGWRVDVDPVDLL